MAAQNSHLIKVIPRSLSLTLFVFFAGALVSRGATVGRLEVDFSLTNGVLRPLHGINKGPLAGGGLIDLTESHRALAVPFTRLHDCHWPNPDVVDIHAIFPNVEANPELPENYDFALTDEYLAAVRRTGARIIYRLGESIEHSLTKRFVHPPANMEKWAAICLGIIRHYNEGWANGFHYNILHWEIWNEPENRPAMWTGSDNDYFRLYTTAARAIRKQYPTLKIGGPAVGYSGQFIDGKFHPSSFVTNFLALCRREVLPLDFFSWHCYTDDSTELVARAKAIRALLDRHGFVATESHLNEWNYLPEKNWKPVSRSASPETRQNFYQRMSGAYGAAFISLALIELQDCPLDLANLFHGETGGFGLFNEFGVPTKNFYALRAFARMLDAPRRVAVSGGVRGKLGLLAGVGAEMNAAAMLVCNFKSETSRFEVDLRNLPWTDGARYKLFMVSERANLDLVLERSLSKGESRLSLDLHAPALALLIFENANTAP